VRNRETRPIRFRHFELAGLGDSGCSPDAVMVAELSRRRGTPGRAWADPDRILDDHWRKAVAAVGDFSHRASLPSASFPSYPVTLTKPR